MKELISQFTLDQTVNWIIGHKEGVVLCCTLNELMMVSENKEIEKIMRRASLVTPDGMPLVWYLKWKYGKGERVYGPDIMRKVIKLQTSNFKKRMFIGDEKNKKYFEKIGEYIVLPFKDVFTENDYEQIAKKINKSRAGIVWVGLGAEKQIRMADGLYRHGVKKVMVTVGAAFDFISGNKKQAPVWVQRMGTEWLYRLIQEPNRLGRRYLKIAIFLVEFGLGRLRKYCQLLWRRFLG